MERSVPKHKSVYILPNLFTTASLFAGFVGMVWAVQGKVDIVQGNLALAEGHFTMAALAILFSALMDGLDGKVARLTNTASEFGIQYDSLADLVAFGAAPALIMYQYALYRYGRVGLAVAFLFTVCSALRLARFNISTAIVSKRFFIGLPTPAAGCTLACIILVVPSLPQAIQAAVPMIALICTAVIAFLMVSRIRYASFKELGFFKARPFRTMVSVIAIFALVVSNPKLFGSLLLFGYIVSGLIHTFVLLPRLSRAANRNADRHSAQQSAQPPEDKAKK